MSTALGVSDQPSLSQPVVLQPDLVVKDYFKGQSTGDIFARLDCKDFFFNLAHSVNGIFPLDLHNCSVYAKRISFLNFDQIYITILKIQSVLSKYEISSSRLFQQKSKMLRHWAKKNAEVLIGETVVYKKDGTSCPCYLKRTLGYSEVVGGRFGGIVPVIKAYVPGVARRVGKCKFEIMPGFFDCANVTYRRDPVVGVLSLYSYKKTNYSGICRALFQSVIEYGMETHAEGRIALHADPAEIGFYFSMGMRTGCEDLDHKILKALPAAEKSGKSIPDYIKDNSCALFLPEKALCEWKQRIQKRTVLSHDFKPSSLPHSRSNSYIAIRA